MALRVLVLDEQEAVRRHVTRALEGDARIAVVAEAASVAEAVRRGRAARPDVAVVGTRLADGAGAHVCQRLWAGVPALRCLVLSPSVGPRGGTAALPAEVSGYLVEPVRAADLASAVRRVASLGAACAHDEPRTIAAATGHTRDPVDLLTRRERAVLRLIGEGLTNRQIGTRLGLTEKTVKNYTSALLGKLGMQRRTQAAVLATELRRRGGEERLAADPAAG